MHTRTTEQQERKGLLKRLSEAKCTQVSFTSSFCLVKERKADTEQLNCQDAPVMAFFFFLNQSSYFKFFPPVFFVFYLEAGKVTFWALLISYLSQLTSFNNKQKSLRIQKHLYKACCFHLDSMSMLSPHTALIQATLPSGMEQYMLVLWLIRNLENCTVRMWLKRNGQYM